MRKNIQSKPLMYPLPVLIIATYCEDGTPNAMNAAWGTICDVDKVAIFLSAEHNTTQNILKRKAFTVSMATEEYVIAADYVGIVSANNIKDKFKKSGFKALKSEFVDAPLIEQLPLTLECEFESFDKQTECLIGRIINVSIDESILNKDGKINLTAFKPIAYDSANHTYVKLGEKIGDAFKDGLKLK